MIFLRRSFIFCLFIALALSGCGGAGSEPTPTVTAPPTVTRFPPTATPTPFPVYTATPVPSFTATSAASIVYYQFVLDASARMTGPFGSGTQWEAAQTALQTMLTGLEPAAQYGLVTIGASPLTEGADACNEPSVARTPFSARSVVANQLSQLTPQGTGSLETAFSLARRQFEGLPANVIRVLVVVTAAADADCPGVDEWASLEKQARAWSEADESSYAAIIVLDEQGDPAIKSIAAGFSRSKQVAFKVASSSTALTDALADVQARLGEFVTRSLNSLPTATVQAATSTPDTNPTNTLSASSYTLTPKPGTATFTPTITLTPTPRTVTPTRTPPNTLTPTATLAPAVNLTSYTFVTTGVSCQIDIVVKVTGSPAQGMFHVLHAGNGPQGDIYPVTLPVGTYNNNQLTLSGNTSSTYTHEVWFEYAGGESNHLKGLICPLLPTPTPTP